MDATTLKIIKDLIISLRGEENPEVIARKRLEIATWMVNVGGEMVNAEFAHKVEFSKIMREENLPAAQAKVKAEGLLNYKTHITLKQLYQDMKSVVSSARTKLDVLANERRYT